MRSRVGPFLIAFIDGDPMTGALKNTFLDVPETKVEDLARVVNDFIAKNL